MCHQNWKCTGFATKFWLVYFNTCSFNNCKLWRETDVLHGILQTLFIFGIFIATVDNKTSEALSLNMYHLCNFCGYACLCWNCNCFVSSCFSPVASLCFSRSWFATPVHSLLVSAITAWTRTWPQVLSDISSRIMSVQKYCLCQRLNQTCFFFYFGDGTAVSHEVAKQ